jgi:hypothetical protein
MLTLPITLDTSPPPPVQAEITPADLDAMLEHWARWASRDRSDTGYPSKSFLAIALDRVRVRQLRGLVRRYRYVSMLRNGEQTAVKESYEPWVAPAKETAGSAIAKRHAADRDELAETIDAAIQAARQMQNAGARSGETPYGDVLLLTLKMHYGVRDETTPRCGSQRAIAQVLGVDESTVSRRLATMRQSIMDQLSTASGYLQA